MAVTEDLIPIVSQYTVSDSTDFTTSLFESLKDIAQCLLEKDNPGLPSDLYDVACALLICHLYESRNPELGLKSYTSGDFSVTREVAGQSVYLAGYYDILDRFTSEKLNRCLRDSSQFTRNDVNMDRMALDDVTIQEFPVLILS